MLSKEFVIPGGKITVSESSGVCSLAITEDIAVGGGEVKGILNGAGTAQINLGVGTGFHIGMALLEAHSPAVIVPFEKVAEAAIGAEIAAQ